MIYLYGLLRRKTHACNEGYPAGVEGEVREHVHADITLLYSNYDGETILPRRRLLIAHARVLEHAMSLGTVLPMRFGMTARSIPEVVDLITKGWPRIQAAFDRIEGKVELGIRITATEEHALAATLSAAPQLESMRANLLRTGAETHFRKMEFGRRLAEALERRRQAFQSSLYREIGDAAEDSVLKSPDQAHHVLRAEYLVKSENRGDFLSRAQELVDACDFASPAKCELTVLGPSPAFHFVDLHLVPSSLDAA